LLEVNPLQGNLGAGPHESGGAACEVPSLTYKRLRAFGRQCSIDENHRQWCEEDNLVTNQVVGQGSRKTPALFILKKKAASA
jgi:hypothetical protein